MQIFGTQKNRVKGKPRYRRGILVLKWEWSSKVHFLSKRSLHISLIIEGCPDTLIMRFTAKPYILWKILFHWICSKFYEFKHGHNFFWPQRSWRLLEAKNTPRRPKLSWRSWFFEKSIKWKFLSNLINPLADPIRFDLRPQVKKIQPPRSLDVHSY